MVYIDNITRKEEERKAKIRKTKTLLDKFFIGMPQVETSISISVMENEKSPSFLSVHNPGNLSGIITLYNEKYHEKTIAFAEEYEKSFNIKNVILRTDYSK